MCYNYIGDGMQDVKEELSVGNLLRKHNLYTKDVDIINYHLNVMWCGAEYLAFKVTGLTDLTEDELATVLYNLILKCDASNKQYDPKIDEEMTRIGNRANVYPDGFRKGASHKFMLKDEGFTFPDEPISKYYDFIDLEDEGKIK